MPVGSGELRLGREDMRSTDSCWLPVFFFSAFMIELQTKSSFRKKGFLFHAPLPLPCPSPREDRAGSVAETMGGTVLTFCLWLAQLPFLHSQGQLPRNGTAHGGLCPPTSVLKKRNPTQICVRPVCWRQFLFSLFSNDS